MREPTHNKYKANKSTWTHFMKNHNNQDTANYTNQIQDHNTLKQMEDHNTLNKWKIVNWKHVVFHKLASDKQEHISWKKT